MKQQVNLYTAELRPQKLMLNAGAAVALVVLVVAMLVGVMVNGHWQNQQRDRQLAQLQQQTQNLEQAVASMSARVQARQPDPELEGALERVSDTIARRQRLLDRVEGLTANNHGGFSGRMSALARQIPGDLWLTSVQLQSAPASMSLEGRTRTADLVPHYLERLGNEPAFIGETFRDFRLSRSDDEASRQWVEFRVATEQRTGAGS
ncbi:PilN domain-containing protein [Marinobacter sp.]|uniref:PilN domain-containing protein n=1 Tax=Marinobacter sp. TaxID=50741 RepID=UPI0019F25B89|nr:PilN domain-containing protein [Marinobacter sp.]MBE0485604.1 PilN domain-containing protein [Marinobacter sp.]